MSFDILSAFIIGLLGSGHCIAMCGGVAGMLTSAVSPPSPASKNSIKPNNIIPNQTIPSQTIPSSHTTTYNKYFFILYYNIGRIFTYALLGGIVGLTGSVAAKNIGVPIAGLRIVAATFLIFLGLYIGQWLMWLNRIESIGKHLWSRISPFAKHVLPVNSKTKAFGLGALWGWLPCGLVYSTLTWSMASGSLFNGAAIMLFFGLGTLPALLTISLGFTSFSLLLKNSRLKKIMALSLIFYGLYSFFVAYSLIF